MNNQPNLKSNKIESSIFESCKYGKIEKDRIFLQDEGYFDEIVYRTCSLGNNPYEDCLLCEDYSKNK